MESDTIQKNGASPKSLMSRGFFLICSMLLLVFCGFTFISCEKIKTSDFSRPEEFIENPSVKEAINGSGIAINKGDNPPALAGTYLTNGRVVNASYLLNSMIGDPLESQFELYNQTASGKISLQEKVRGLTAWGSGGYVTGDNGRFTVYIESRQSGSEAGLPNGISANVVLLMSGTKLSNGNLSAKGLTTITEVSITDRQYDEVKIIEGSWYIWEADFYLQTGTRSAEISFENEKNWQSMNEITRDIIEKIITSEQD